MSWLMRRTADCRKCPRRISFVIEGSGDTSTAADVDAASVAELASFGWTQIRTKLARRLPIYLRRVLGHPPFYTGRCETCSPVVGTTTTEKP
jgi:hypothetical protein